MDPHIPLVAALLADENHRRNYARIQRRHLRDNQNPFEIPDDLFIQNYRLNKEASLDVISRLEQHVETSTHGNAVPFHIKVLATLNFCGTGSYQRPVGASALHCLSQPMVSRAVQEVCRLIARHLMPQYINFPTTAETVGNVKLRFYENWGMRGIIGAIDGTHVDILAPPHTNADQPPFVYINRKGKHSINVMLISNADCNILAANARYPGSTHDAAVWQLSAIRAHCVQQFDVGERQSYLIGDSGYPLEPWLLVPYTNVIEGTPEYQYNKRFKSARNIIERTNGLLKCRFRCLSRHRVLHYSPDAAAYIIYTCCVLHNICNTRNIALMDVLDPEEHEIPQANPENIAQNRLYNIARNIRNEYVANLF